MAKITNGEALDLVVLSKASAPIGFIQQSLLTLSQFQAENLGTWVLADGQSCIGTLYHTVTGNTTVPDATTGMFLRQAKSGRALGSVEQDAFQGHFHEMTLRSTGMAGGSGQAPWTSSGSGTPLSSWVLNNKANYTSDGVNGTPRVADETRPKNIAVNFFVKVGY